jgi:hypothetical protein
MTVSIRESALQHVREIYLSPLSLIILVAGPSVVFTVIWLLRGGNALNANFFMGSALMLAVVAPAFDQLAIGLNADRFQKTTGGTEGARIVARLWSWAGAVVGASILLIVIASMFSPMSLTVAGWLRFAFAVVIGAVPIGFAAVSLSFWLSPEKIRRWTNCPTVHVADSALASGHCPTNTSLRRNRVVGRLRVGLAMGVVVMARGFYRGIRHHHDRGGAKGTAPNQSDRCTRRRAALKIVGRRKTGRPPWKELRVAAALRSRFTTKENAMGRYFFWFMGSRRLHFAGIDSAIAP